MLKWKPQKLSPEEIKKMFPPCNRIRLIKIEKEVDDYFLFAGVHFQNKEYLCKFIVDRKTAVELKMGLTLQPFKEKYGKDYMYWCHSYFFTHGEKEDHSFKLRLLIKLGRKRQAYNVPCSKFFIQNIVWLGKIENPDDLSYAKVDSLTGK